jgi:hypothetical protein
MKKNLNPGIYLDLRNLPFSVEKNLNGKELVRQLIIVAKRAMTIDIEEMSNDPKGHTDDGLPGYRDRVTTVKTKLEHREDINLKINDIVEAVGVKLVIPARTSYIKKLPDSVTS